MRTVQIKRFGGPEVLEVAEISSPEPQGDEILLEVEAAGVNRADLFTRAGLYQRRASTAGAGLRGQRRGARGRRRGRAFRPR
jgi:NADPH:quinone reductase-like Zn-dependent oxidoreductase